MTLLAVSVLLEVCCRAEEEAVFSLDEAANEMAGTLEPESFSR